MGDLKGLKPQDRADWEKQYADKIQGFSPEDKERAFRDTKFKEKFGERPDYSKLKTLTPEQRDSMYNEYTFNRESSNIELPQEVASSESIRVDRPNLDLKEQLSSLNTDEEVNKRRTNEELYNSALNRYNTWKGRADEALNVFDQVAGKVSPYYKRFKGTEYLPLNEEEKLKMVARYQADRDTYGEESATLKLQSTLKDIASDNQPLSDKIWNGFAGAGADLVGGAFQLAGLLPGILGIAPREGEIEAPSSVLDYFDRILDNDFSRFGNEVRTSGTLLGTIGAQLDDEGVSGWFKDLLSGSVEAYNAAKKTGISNTEIITSTEEDTGSIIDNLLSVNTIPKLLQQQGFTIASMLSGTALSAASNALFKGVKGATMALNKANTVEKAAKLTNSLQNIQKAQQFTNAFVIPGMVGWIEGASEGLSAKLDYLDDAQQQVEDTYKQAVEGKFNSMLSNPEELSRLGYNPQDANDIQRLYKDIEESYLPQYKESAERAEENSKKVGVYTMGANSFVNGLANTTLKAGLFQPSVQESLRRSRLGRLFTGSKFKVTPNGVSSPYGFWKKAANIAQEPFGEALEEGSQSIITAATTAGGENNLANFLHNKYLGEGAEAVNESFADDLGAAMVAAGDAVTDKQTILSSIYGALSSSIGTVTINNRRGPKQRLEGEGSLAYRLRRLPVMYRNPIWESVREQNEGIQDRAEMSTILTDWMRDPVNKNRYDGLTGTFNWAKQMEESAGDNDEFAYRNSALGKTVNDVVMLDNLKGTPFYESFYSDLVKTANTEEGTPQAQDLVAQFKSSVANKDVEMTDAEILEHLKSNATKMLETTDRITEESKAIDRLLGNAATPDTKQALIYGKLQMDNWRDRATKLEDEISQVRVEPTVTSTATPEQREALIGYGSSKRLEEDKSKLVDKIESIQKDIDNIKKRKHHTKQEEQILKSKQTQVKKLNSDLKKLNKSVVEGVDEAILNESDIMALLPQQRAIMLNPENRSHYSEAQQAVIDNVVKEGTSVYSDFINKIQDAGRVNLAQEDYYRQYNQIISDPEVFNAYANRLKHRSAEAAKRRQYESLNEIKDYPTFAKEVSKVVARGNLQELQALSKVLENNPNMERFGRDNEILDGVFTQLNKSKLFGGLDSNGRNAVRAAARYIVDNGVDPSNRQEVLNLLTDTDGVNIPFLNYVRDLNSVLPEDQKVNVTPETIEEVIGTYINALEEYNSNEEEVAKITAPVTPVTPPPSSTNIWNQLESSPELAREEITEITPTETIPESVVQEEVVSEEPQRPTIEERSEVVEEEIEEVGEEETESSQKSPIISKYLETSGEEVAKSVEEVINSIQEAPDIFGDAKEWAVNALDELGDKKYADQEEFSNAVITYANKVAVLSQEGGDLQDRISSLLSKAGAKLRKTVSNVPTKPVEPITPTRQPRGTVVNTNSGEMESLNISRPAYKEIADYYKVHKVHEFLLEDRIDESTPVYFMTDPALTSTVREAMGEKYTENDLPIIAVVEVESGKGINIEGKNYQPIAVMPASDNPNKRGAARLTPVRQLGLFSEGIIKDTEGNPVTTTMISIKAEPPRSTDSTQANNSLHQILFNDLSEEDRARYIDPNAPIEEKRAIYNKAREEFVKKIKPLPKDKKIHRSRLSYVTPNLKKKQTTELEVLQTPLRNTRSRAGEPILDLLNREDPAVLLTANSRIARYAKTLVDFFASKPFEDKPTFDMQGETLIPIGNTAEVLRSVGDKLGKSLGNFINIPSTAKYTVTPTTEDVQGHRLYNLSVSWEGENIFLGKVTNGTMGPATQARIISNLILNTDGSLRYRDNKMGFAEWNVPWQDFAKSDPNAYAIFDDNILESSHTTFKYRVNYVTLNAPFPSEGHDGPITTTVANPTNATTGVPVNTPSLVGEGQTQVPGAIVDTDFGTTLEGKPETLVLNETIAEPSRVETSEPSVEAPSKMGLKVKNRFKKKATPQTVVSPLNTVYDSLTEQQKKALTARGITKEVFDNLKSEEERKHFLDCI